MTVRNAFRTVIMYSHYGQSLWTVIMTVLFFIMTVQNDCLFCEMKISSHKNVRPLFIVKSEFLGYNVQCPNDAEFFFVAIVVRQFVSFRELQPTEDARAGAVEQLPSYRSPLSSERLRLKCRASKSNLKTEPNIYLLHRNCSKSESQSGSAERYLNGA